MADFTVVPVYMDEDSDGTRTAPGGYLDSGKCPAYRGFRWRRGRHDRQRGGGHSGREQRVLRATAIGQRSAERVGDEGLHHGETVDDSDAYSGRQHVHPGGTDAHTHHAHTHHAHTDAHHADTDPHYAHADANHAGAHANPHYADAHPNHADGDAD